MEKDAPGRSARRATPVPIDAIRPAVGRYTGGRRFSDLDDRAHSDMPAGFEMTLTGPETGPFVTTWAWLERGSIQFGTEGGPNVGHGLIPDRLAVFHVALDGPAPLAGGVVLGPTRVAVLGPGADQIEAVRGPGRWVTFAAELDVIDEAASRLGLSAPVYERGRAGVVAVGRDAAGRLRRLIEEVEPRLVNSPGEFSEPDVRATCLRQVTDEFVAAVAAGRRVPPRGGKAAEEHARILLSTMHFLGATKDHAVTIGELCRAAGTSQRTLSRVFRESFEISPARYLRLRRMNQVRAWLRRGVPAPATVTEAATRFGFFELGRFAGDYRRLFGELPSDTLRKAGRAT